MKKGQNKRVWTPEQKAEIVYKHLNDHISVRTLEKEYHADRSMICKWVKKYIAEGESSFVHKGHPGNPFAALHVSKNLSEVERLRLTVAKLEVENERLKKDTWRKEVVHPRSSLLAEKRVRGHRHAQIQISRKFSLQGHGCKSIRLLQMEKAKRKAQ